MSYEAKGWTFLDYAGRFPATAVGPGDMSIEMSPDGEVTIEHQVPSDYYPSDITARVSIPVEALAELLRRHGYTVKSPNSLDGSPSPDELEAKGG